MRLRFLPFLLLLLTPAVLQAQDTVTGHVTLPSGTAPSNVKICFSLGNFAPNAPKVINTGTLVAVKNFCITPAADGSYSTPLMGNDVITPISTNWRVDFLVNGLQQSSATYYVNHTPFNLDTEIPLSVTTPAGPNQMVTQAFPFTQLTPATTWTITHNFNDSNTIVSAADANGQQIFPDTVNCRTNPNVCTLTFVTATSGFAIAMHAGAINIAITQPNAVVQNPLGTQTLSGTFNIGTSGNVSVKAAANDQIQYVSNNGNDTNDGFSWGTAKKTIAAACAAFTNENSSCTGAGNGAVLVAPSFSGAVPACFGQSPVCTNVNFGVPFPFISSNSSIISYGAIISASNAGGVIFHEGIFGQAPGHIATLQAGDVAAGSPVWHADLVFSLPDLALGTSNNNSGYLLGADGATLTTAPGNCLYSAGPPTANAGGVMLNSGFGCNTHLSFPVNTQQVIWKNGANSVALTSAAATASQTVTLPNATGNVAVLPTVTTTETGSGAVVKATSAALVTPTIGGETVTSAPRGFLSGYIPAGNTGVNTYYRTILDKGITVTRVIVNAATQESGVTTHAVIRVTDGTTNLDTTFVNATQVYDSGAISQNYAAGATLDIRIATSSSGGTPASNIGVTVEYKMQ